jgi:hypothetical protein
MFRNPEGLPNIDRTSQEYYERCMAQVPTASDGSRDVLSLYTDRAPLSYDDLTYFDVPPGLGYEQFKGFLRLIKLSVNERDQIVRSLPYYEHRLYFVIGEI